MLHDPSRARKILAEGADPQKPSTIFDQFLRALKTTGVNVTSRVLSVEMLHATQKEIYANKVYPMITAIRNNQLPTQALIISNDFYILDGHHRWAAMMLINPKLKIPVWQIDLPIYSLLDRCFQYPGVFRE
jgi:hypothetical protein